MKVSDKKLTILQQLKQESDSISLPKRFHYLLQKAKPKKIIEQSEQAPFGEGEKIIIGTEVRKVWHILRKPWSLPTLSGMPLQKPKLQNTP